MDAAPRAIPAHRRLGRWMALLVIGLIGAGCGGGPAASTQPTGAGQPTTSTAPTTAPSSAAEATTAPSTGGCPNPAGGECLGLLAAGTYTTKTVSPTVTYTVPDGWQNLEDAPGAFSLTPAGTSWTDYAADLSDFVAVLETIVAPNGCDGTRLTSVAETPAAINAWIKTAAGVTVTSKPVTLGGLQGFVLDIKQLPTWKATCDWAHGDPVVMLLLGVARTRWGEAIRPGRAWRVYLLPNGDRTMAVLIADTSGGSRIAELDAVAQSMTFAP